MKKVDMNAPVSDIARNRITVGLLVFAGVLLMALLTACGGGTDGGGEYWGQDQMGQPARLTVDGDQVTYEELDCDGELDETETSNGVLNDAQTSVTWTDSDGRWHGDDDVTVTDSTITLGDGTYVLGEQPSC